MSLKINQKKLRKNKTYPEKQFQKLLFKHKIKHHTQKIIGFYIVDFHILHTNILIELDGKYHLKKEQILKDKKRDRILKAQGYKVKRILNGNIKEYDFQQLKKIQSYEQKIKER